MKFDDCINCGLEKVENRFCITCKIFRKHMFDSMEKYFGAKFKPLEDDGEIHFVGANGKEVGGEEWLKLKRESE